VLDLWEDYTYWLAAARASLKRISRLIDEACVTPPPESASPSLFAACLRAPGPGGSAKDTGSST
jgi:hypothetical protein